MTLTLDPRDSLSRVARSTAGAAAENGSLSQSMREILTR